MALGDNEDFIFVTTFFHKNKWHQLEIVIPPEEFGMEAIQLRINNQVKPLQDTQFLALPHAEG